MKDPGLARQGRKGVEVGAVAAGGVEGAGVGVVRRQIRGRQRHRSHRIGLYGDQAAEGLAPRHHKYLVVSRDGEHAGCEITDGVGGGVDRASLDRRVSHVA